MDNDDDFALANSFINFDYTPPVFGSGTSFSDSLVVCFGVEERFKSFTLVENDEIIDDKDVIVNEMVEIRREITCNDLIRVRLLLMIMMLMK